jgi:phospholipid-binding lipoprotein MlaA
MGFPVSQAVSPISQQISGRRVSRLLPVLAILLLSACAAPEGYVARDGINDPYEQRNRNVHAFNKSVDRAVLRPLSRGYDRVVPDEMQDMVNNFASNLSTPRLVVNNLLQGNVEGALANTTRFFLNTTLGFAGLVDVGNIAGLNKVDTDFGETLHVWGVAEGAYMETPFRGPSTQRDTVGRIVDLFLNPLPEALSGTQNDIRIGAQALDVVGDRARFGQTIDSVLYDSADSYAQSRLIYLQSRRFALGRSGDADYEDPYDLGSTDPYEDPYAD